MTTFEALGKQWDALTVEDLRRLSPEDKGLRVDADGITLAELAEVKDNDWLKPGRSIVLVREPNYPPNVTGWIGLSSTKQEDCAKEFSLVLQSPQPKLASLLPFHCQSLRRRRLPDFDF
jgi:hypothetical protein